MIRYLSLLILFVLSSCSRPTPLDLQSDTCMAYIPMNRAGTWAPVFVAEQAHKSYNRIGTPSAKLTPSGQELVYVDPAEATVYVDQQDFETARGRYRNHLYRVHFEETPSGLGQGKNVGLMVIVTVDRQERPLLVTTVHTCGCYAAVVPTDYLDPSALPKGWSPNKPQSLHGEELSSMLYLRELRHPAIAVALRSGSHRVAQVWAEERSKLAASYGSRFLEAATKPADALHRLETENGPVSFFYEEGAEKGLVKGSEKPNEKLLMSWWSFDQNIGEDKAFGAPEETGQRFYTSLAFWKRDESNLWNFAGFLNDRGWRL